MLAAATTPTLIHAIAVQRYGDFATTRPSISTVPVMGILNVSFLAGLRRTFPTTPRDGETLDVVEA